MPYSNKRQIPVGCRGSNLSLIQVEEIQDALHKHHSDVELLKLEIETEGDRDLETSLRTMPKNDFFTRDIDVALARGDCRIGIHSAKDLPEHLHPELEIAAMTACLDPRDSMVIPEGETLDSLPAGANIATSTISREQRVREMREDFKCVDIRGTIEQRLEQLDFGRVDGVVIAECALMRLGLTHLNRITLPGESTPHQGQLAIVVRKDDSEMRELFKCLDSR